jgi:hypothetical protein
MEEQKIPEDVCGIIPVEAGTSVQGSAHDAALRIDTTPASRVEWPADGDSAQRSAHDAKLIVETTPAARIEPAAPVSTGPAPAITSAEPVATGSDGLPAASSDQQPA